jgi:hypothetical protein
MGDWLNMRGAGSASNGCLDDALGNAARAVFSASGPMLSLSVSLRLLEFGTRNSMRNEPLQEQP